MVLILYLLLINLLTFIVFYRDKRLAVQHRYRISEFTLLFLCALGGSLGGLLSMIRFHHKTRHLKFTLGVPLLLAWNLAASLLIYYTVY